MEKYENGHVELAIWTQMDRMQASLFRSIESISR